MGRKKLKREYCIVITIDGEEYYSYGISRGYSYTRTIRLTKDSSKAYKIKTKKILQKQIDNILNGIQFYEFKLNRNVIATSDDLLEGRIKYVKENLNNENIKFGKLKENIPNSINKSNMDYVLNGIMKLSKIANDITFLNSYLVDFNSQKLKLEKKNYKPKNIEFKIIDASFNFRYSKLKKLIEQN